MYRPWEDGVGHKLNMFSEYTYYYGLRIGPLLSKCQTDIQHVSGHKNNYRDISEDFRQENIAFISKRMTMIYHWIYISKSNTSYFKKILVWMHL